MQRLIGKHFGRLVVLYPTEKRKHKEIIWKCQCNCGETTEVYTHNLVSGNTRSCGCLRREKSIKRFTIHGDEKNGKQTRLYRIWGNIKKRCYSPNSPRYKRYGGRGIFMFDEWKNDYRNFKNWALLNGYQDSLTIDRINNDSDYEPNNCQWITKSENSKKRHRESKNPPVFQDKYGRFISSIEKDGQRKLL